MNLIITGGAGFLGYHLYNQLFDKYDEILVIDIAPFSSSEYPKNVKYIKGDIRDLSLLKRAFEGYDFVVHSAAALPLWKKKDILTTTIKGTENVLVASLENKIKRVVYVSSTAVYGMPKKSPIYEDDPLIGIGPYGKAKIKAEKICEEYRKKGLCIPIVRPKTFIGEARLGIFQILYDWVKSGKRIPVIGNGENRYQLLEVEDLVDAIYLLLTLEEERVNDTFNVGAKEFKRAKEDLADLCDFAKSKSRVMTTPAGIIKTLLWLFWTIRISPLYKWVYETADKDSFVSIEKIEKKCGFLPKYSNSDALIKSYQWYLKHCDEIQTSGTTHRVAWKQGILGLFKKIL
ncbi:MAG: NAD-dependent epimerase/dehydratase family protein [bacterium]